MLTFHVFTFLSYYLNLSKSNRCCLTQIAISRGLNGIGLAIVTPAILSLVADSTHESNRGTAFGWLALTGGLGSLSLYRSLVQCLCYPIAAFLAARHNRANVIALGAFLWSGATFLVAISSTFAEVSASILCFFK